MQTGPVPRQRRSLRTQEKLLDALEQLLEARFFEHITIQDIAATAGVAVGTVYRRFRNKEALLPALYLRLDARYEAWADTVWPAPRAAGRPASPPALRERLRTLVAAHIRFYRRNAPILRTLYLQARLDPTLAEPAVARQRKALYRRLLGPVFEWYAAAGQPAPSAARSRCFVLLLLSPLTERCLFPDNTPAASLRISDRRFASELTEALYHYLLPTAD